MDLHGLTRSGASSGQRHPVGDGEAVQLLRLRGRRARPAREASAPPGVLQPHLHPHLLQHHHLPPPSSSSSATTTSTYSSARLHHILHHHHVRPHSLILMLAQTPLGCMHVWASRCARATRSTARRWRRRSRSCSGGSSRRCPCPVAMRALASQGPACPAFPPESRKGAPARSRGFPLGRGRAESRPG